MPPRHEIRVGLLILFAAAVFVVGVLMIGEKGKLFVRKNRYFADFESVSGLSPGSTVELDGVSVGKVEEIELPRDPKRHEIRVWVSVDRRYEDRLRGPVIAGATGHAAGASQASLHTLGLLGDKFMSITSGSETLPVIEEEEQIASAKPTDVDALLASGEDVVGNVVQISHSLNTILTRIEKGEGLVGELTTDSASGRELKGSLLATLASLNRAAASLEHGKGPLPHLLNDAKMAERLNGSLEKLDALIAQAGSGAGVLPALLGDKAERARFDEILASLDSAAKDLQVFTANLKGKDALLPRLVNDADYGQKVTGEVNGIVGHLGSVAAKLDTGDGTAAKLINDPKIYDAFNDIIVGVNQSWMLRWLVRNRQKSGIHKRYRDATGQAGTGAKDRHDAQIEPLSLQPTPSAEPVPPPGDFR
ncbi:MAG TPA: MlaD family protein [Thermoanaerobaculia bacterium]